MTKIVPFLLAVAASLTQISFPSQQISAAKNELRVGVAAIPIQHMARNLIGMARLRIQACGVKNLPTAIRTGAGIKAKHLMMTLVIRFSTLAQKINMTASFWLDLATIASLPGRMTIIGRGLSYWNRARRGLLLS